MLICPRCGAQVPDGIRFCPQCGYRLDAVPQQPYNAVPPGYQQQYGPPPGYGQPYNCPPGSPFFPPYGTPPSGQLSIGYLVWSIIVIAMLCWPLGLAALISTLNAKKAFSAEEEQRKLKTALTCNIIGTVLGALIIILLFFSWALMPY